VSGYRGCVTNLELYRESLADMSPGTVRAYVGAVQQLERHAGKPIDQITAVDARAWIRQPHLSQGSRNTYHRWLSAYARWAGRPDLLEGVRRTSRPLPSPKPVSPERVSLMLAACRDVEETALVLLPLLVGLRRAETAGFRGTQLDRWDGTVRVVQGKGGKDAVVQVPPALVRHASRMPAGFWFPSEGGHVSAWTIWRRTVDLSARAGAGHVPPHRLRHTYATELVKGGAPLTSVQRCMRHSQLATTAAYVGVSQEDLRAAVLSLPWAA
jgi:integrase/recombinase XerD